ncbi:MAG TPA: ABC transporter permease [Bryobacteraceae bacterium]|nr:ABC transporter permease [Bryobacteraceae bacterium]
MRRLVEDLRHSTRTLRKNPGFAAASIVTLVAGIILNTAVFGMLNALWFRPLPIRSSEQVVIVSAANAQLGPGGMSFQDYSDVRRTRSFEDAAAFSPRAFNVSGPVAGGEPLRTVGGAATANTLGLLGFKPVVGRGFTDAEQAAGAQVALIGERLWRHRFGADPAITGSVIRLDGRPVTVIGVLPYEFRFIYADYDLLVPLSPEMQRGARSDRPLEVLARLKPGATPEQARAEVSALAAQLAGAYPESNRGWTMTVEDYRESMLSRHTEYTLLMPAAALLLLIVCANVSGLFLAKAAARQRDVAVRMALGAPRLAIVRQMLTEGMVIAMSGGSLALIGAYWVRQILVASFPQLRFLEVDFRVAGYTLLVSLMAGIAFGLAPALAAARPDVNEILKTGGRGPAGGGANRLRSALVVAELALGVMLVTGAGLLAKTIANLRNIDVGFPTANLVFSQVALEGEQYANPEARDHFWEELIQRLSSAPGITAATLASNAPLSGFVQSEKVEVEGRSARTGGDVMRIVSTVADTRYTGALGIRTVAGRMFTRADHRNAPNVAVVNESFVRRVWPGASLNSIPGKRVRIGDQGAWVSITGVVADARQALAEAPFAEVVTPVAQAKGTTMHVIVRTAPNTSSPGAAIRAVVAAIDPDLPVMGPATMDGVMENSYPTVLVSGLALFALIATALATLGLYGVVSFLVIRRTHEIGIRLALGASRAAVLRLVLGHSLKLTAIGAVIGIAGAFGLARLMSGFLQGVSSADPVVFASVAGVLGAAALAAGTVPAIRAARVDPIVSLRCE